MKLALGCFAATVLITTAACGPRNQDFEKTADTALESAALDDVDANWDNDAKTIHLTGTVNSEDERQRDADVDEGPVAQHAADALFHDLSLPSLAVSRAQKRARSSA